AGRGRGRAGEGRGAGAPGPGTGGRQGGAGSPGSGGPSLRLSWSDYASLYGEEELEREREMRALQRRSSVRGARRQARWRRFRAALENYTPHVRVGNQTALNAAASPFATYLAAIHRRIHQRFAEGFLAHPPSTVERAFAANPDMHTMLEIGIAEDGTVERLGIIATSGDILFDLGAFNSVLDAQPFPPTPARIRSPNGLTYFHWGFYRNHRQCGTFTARSILLAEALPRDRDRPDLAGPGLTPLPSTAGEGGPSDRPSPARTPRREPALPAGSAGAGDGARREAE
ncbi:MAG: TonB C-terminal domain-containing protein, partial [Sandaracinaceae bacterium]